MPKPAMSYEEAYIAFMDDMSDGQWHPMSKIMRLNGANFGSQKTLAKLVEKMHAESTLISGSNNSYRMTREALESWRLSRGLSMQASPRDMSAPRFFGGILEDDGWLRAPLREMEVVHCHASETAASIIRDRVGLHGMTLYNFEGLVRIFALDGSAAYQLLKDLKEEMPDLGISGIRIDKNVRRRELCDLPPRFIHDLAEFYGVFAFTLLRKSMSSVRKHISDTDDLQQQVYLWIIDAVQRYDEATSIPFAAYLHSAINRWVHDLSRKSFGRAVADSELQISRARTEFQQHHNRKPTLNELADFLGEPVEKVRKKLQGVANVSNIRSAGSIHTEDGDLPLVAADDSTSRHDEQVERNILSAALTSSALHHSRGPAISAWCNIYARTWGGGSSDRVSETEKDVMASMREKLAEIR